MVNNIPIYVLHVKEGYEDRRESIERQMSVLGFRFDWVLEHDVPDITEADRRRYRFTESLSPSELSCALKHIRAWQRIADWNAEGAIVFEDDVLLNIDLFRTVLDNALDEYHTKQMQPGCIAGCIGYRLQVLRI